LLSSVIALAASNITIYALWCRQLSVIIPSAIDVVDEFDKWNESRETEGREEREENIYASKKCMQTGCFYFIGE